jgi:hypothetical protein
MTYQRPFVTRSYTAYAGDSRTRHLSLAVRLVDEFDDGVYFPNTNVFLRELRAFKRYGPIKNGDNYYCFVGVEQGTYTVTIDLPASRRGWFNLRRMDGGLSPTLVHPVDIPLSVPLNPWVSPFFLSPTPSYAFPKLATLVRGSLRSGQPSALQPVNGARVRTVYQHTHPSDPDQSVAWTIDTLSDRHGEFVLFFRAMYASAQIIEVVAESAGQSGTQPATVIQGQTTKGVNLILS